MDFLRKVDKLIPVAGKAIYFTITGLRAKMLGKTYVDVLNTLHYEFTLPETEETWKKRQDLLGELAVIFDNRKDNVALPKDFVERVKAILPDIVTAASSERTTLSAQACRVVCRIAKHLESQIQPQLDMLLSQLMVHCGSTKGVNQKNANEAITLVCKHAGYSPRLFYHVCSAFRDKRIPPRAYAPEWLRILIASYRSQMDREKDGEAARTAIYQGLTDGQVKVRENSRAVYWEYATYDAQGARMIMGGLNPHAQAALREDPHNPDKSAQKVSRAPRPDSALASIKAQSKQRMQQHRGFTPASLKPDDFVFGSMDDLDALTYKKSAQKPGTAAGGDKQDKRAAEPHHASHHSESAGSSRQGISTQHRANTKVSKDTKLETSRDLKASSPQVDARPLLSAPVRRGRIVATPMSNPGHRPASRGETSKRSFEVKKSFEVKDKALPEKPTGRRTPISVVAEKEASLQHVAEGKENTYIIHKTLPEKPTGRQTPIPVVAEKEASLQHVAEGKENTYVIHKTLPENSSGRQTPITAGEKETTLQHVAEGKENTYVIRPRKKRSPASSPRRSPNRSSNSSNSYNQSPKRSPRRNSIAASAKRSLATAVEYLRNGNLDALGYRRLRKLIENHPGVLITSQAQFDDLFELLITKLASWDELSESRERRLESLGHPAYNRQTMIFIIFLLFQQYPQYPEPQPGMTLSALIVARCNHSNGYVSLLKAIEDSIEILCACTRTLLPSIDAVLDTLEQIEHIITTNDPIVTPNSATTIIWNSLQSLASEFGPERPRFSNRLPIIMAFGLRVLCLLLGRLVSEGQTLYTIQEDRLASFAEHLLATYTSLIKRYVMEYCTALHAVIKPEKRFYNFFSKEGDRNLINYFVAGAEGVEIGGLEESEVFYA